MRGAPFVDQATHELSQLRALEGLLEGLIVLGLLLHHGPPRRGTHTRRRWSTCEARVAMLVVLVVEPRVPLGGVLDDCRVVDDVLG